MASGKEVAVHPDRHERGRPSKTTSVESPTVKASTDRHHLGGAMLDSGPFEAVPPGNAPPGGVAHQVAAHSLETQHSVT